MSPTIESLGVAQMSVADRIALIGEIWDSIAAMPESIHLTEAQEQEIERRLSSYEADPSKVTPWETVKAEALARMKK